MKPGFLPSRLVRAFPSDAYVNVDTFNGNLVFMSINIMKMAGFGNFSHGYGDIDFGLRAKRMGINPVLVPGLIAVCAPNNHPEPWLNLSQSKVERLKALFSVKGLPWRDHFRFYKSNLGFIGYPAALISLIIKVGNILVSEQKHD